MTRRVFTGTEWEPVVGYSRAVAAGDYVFVAGCTSVVGAEFVHEDDACAQTAQALRNVAAALAQLGLGLTDVVSTRILVTENAGSDLAVVDPAAALAGSKHALVGFVKTTALPRFLAFEPDGPVVLLVTGDRSEQVRAIKICDLP